MKFAEGHTKTPSAPKPPKAPRPTTWGKTLDSLKDPHMEEGVKKDVLEGYLWRRLILGIVTMFVALVVSIVVNLTAMGAMDRWNEHECYKQGRELIVVEDTPTDAQDITCAR